LRFRWRTYLQESFWNWIEFSQFFVYIGYALEELYLGNNRIRNAHAAEHWLSEAAAAAAKATASAVITGGSTAARLLKTVGKSSST
jgi:hypothetical protein